MIRDFSVELVGLPGHILTDDKGAPLSLRPISVQSLLGQFPDEANLSGDDKYRRFKLAERISSDGPQEVSAEEIALIKKLIGKGYGPMIVGPAYEALEKELSLVQPAVS